MGPVVRKVAAVALAGLALAGFARRRRSDQGPWWRDPPGAGVREPRHPLQPAGSAAAAAEPPAE